MFKCCVLNSFVTVYFVDLYFKHLYAEWVFSWGFHNTMRRWKQRQGNTIKELDRLQIANSKQEKPNILLSSPDSFHCQVPSEGQEVASNSVRTWRPTTIVSKGARAEQSRAFLCLQVGSRKDT